MNSKEIFICDQDYENQLNLIKVEKDENYKAMQQIKANLRELNETKSMLIEEITGKMMQRADLLSQIEYLGLKQAQMKTSKSKDIEFFFEEKELKEKMKILERENNDMEAELFLQASEIKKIEAKLKTIYERKKYVKLEIDLKNNEKTKKFMVLIKEKDSIEAIIEGKLKEIEAGEVFAILVNTSKILLENLDEFNEQQIKDLLSYEKLLDDLQRFFEEKTIEKDLQENPKEEIRNYYNLLMNYAIFRKLFEINSFKSILKIKTPKEK